VVIHGRKYFAFSNYTGTGANATSYCDQTLPGWTHDLLGHDWACYYGQKVDALPPKSTPQYLQFVLITFLYLIFTHKYFIPGLLYVTNNFICYECFCSEQMQYNNYTWFIVSNNYII